MAAVIEKALLVLAQTVVVLVIRRSERGADLVKSCIPGPLVVEHAGCAVLMVGHRHLPALHIEQRASVGGAEVDVGSGSRTDEVLGDIQFGG
jgi:hypothetical protein